jgi:hypothetical protein
VVEEGGYARLETTGPMTDDGTADGLDELGRRPDCRGLDELGRRPDCRGLDELGRRPDATDGGTRQDRWLRRAATPVSKPPVP